MKKLILVITALGLIAGSASSLEARNRNKRTDKKEMKESVYAKATPDKKRRDNGRGARVGGVLVGAGAGGGIAAAAGSAKWAALGAPLGGFAGYFLVRAIQKGRKNREARKGKAKASE